MNISVPMKSPHFSEASYNAVIDEYIFWMDKNTMELEDFYFSEMMPAKYKKADLELFAEKQTHLSKEQQRDLL